VDAEAVAAAHEPAAAAMSAAAGLAAKGTGDWDSCETTTRNKGERKMDQMG